MTQTIRMLCDTAATLALAMRRRAGVGQDGPEYSYLNASFIHENVRVVAGGGGRTG